jgi:hypothetical protein
MGNGLISWFWNILGKDDGYDLLHGDFELDIFIDQ